MILHLPLTLTLTSTLLSACRAAGRDGYDKVIQVVEALQDDVPLSLMFCLLPWNNYNQIYSQGYFSELQAFVNAVESRQNHVLTDLQSVRSVFEVMAEIHDTISRNHIRIQLNNS